MRYVISYDIRDDKRRYRVYKFLKKWGEWVQLSVFELILDKRDMEMLKNRLRKLIKEEEDSIRIYPLCSTCSENLEIIGEGKPVEYEDTYFV